MKPQDQVFSESNYFDFHAGAESIGENAPDFLLQQLQHEARSGVIGGGQCALRPSAGLRRFPVAVECVLGQILQGRVVLHWRRRNPAALIRLFPQQLRGRSKHRAVADQYLASDRHAPLHASAAYWGPSIFISVLQFFDFSRLEV